MFTQEQIEKNETELRQAENLLRFEKEAKPNNHKKQLEKAEEVIRLYKERCRMLANAEPL